MNNQLTKQDLSEAIGEVMEAIHGLASHIDERFQMVDQRFERLEGRVEKIAKRMNILVTKEYLDDKLADLKGDLILLARKQNRKLEHVIEAFVEQGTLSRKVADQLLALEPFAQT